MLGEWMKSNDGQAAAWLKYFHFREGKDKPLCVMNCMFSDLMSLPNMGRD